jgi:hypothetical protein
MTNFDNIIKELKESINKEKEAVKEPNPSDEFSLSITCAMKLFIEDTEKIANGEKYNGDESRKKFIKLRWDE